MVWTVTCNRLFAIERELRDLKPEARHAARQLRSRPVCEEFFQWLGEMQPHILPKSQLGAAVTYCLNHREKLERFLEDGRLEIDNNRAERSIKPFVIGRKNWLFANTPRGARASALLYSVVETAKENGLRPAEYLVRLLKALPNLNTQTDADIDALLPWNVRAESTAKPEVCVN